MRVCYVERLPDLIVAERFGYSPGYFSQLRHKFRYLKIDLSGPVTEGKVARYKISIEAQQKIVERRQKLLSAGEIAELLAQVGSDVSVRAVERVLAEESFPKLPRGTQL